MEALRASLGKKSPAKPVVVEPAAQAAPAAATKERKGARRAGTAKAEAAAEAPAPARARARK